MTVPYAKDNLGEETYPTPKPGTPDRLIDNQEAHDQFYKETGPEPYPA